MKGRASTLLGGILLMSFPCWGATLELVPKVGYQFTSARDLAGPAYTSLKMDNAALAGVSLGYLTKASGEFEVSWLHSNTMAQIDQTGGAPAQRFDAGIDQIHFNALYMLSDTPFQPFALLGVGATLYSASG